MKFAIPPIPIDQDAKGIVVRVISYEYYLKKFWLTFIDPYIEVEYQISTRRMRLQQSSYLSLLIMIYGIYILTYPYLQLISDNPAKNKTKILCIVFGLIFIITSIIELFIVYSKIINNIFNWPILFTIKNSTMFFIFYFIMLDDIFNIEYQSKLTNLGNELLHFMYIFDTETSHTIFTYVLTTFILTILPIALLNVKQFLILVFIHSTFALTLIFRYKDLCFRDYRELYESIGWHMGVLLIEGLVNETLTALGPTIHTFRKLANNKKQINDIYPYESSIFNINKYFSSNIDTYMFLWIILILFLLYVVYIREKSLRADFILRRVQSDKDKPRNLESGIKIQSLININETKEEREIIQDNLEKWKKYSSSNSSNNQNFEIDLEEKESIVDTLALMELGDAFDSKTVKSFDSDNSFKRDKNNIIESVKNIVPKSYTKSEKNKSINDTESESHVQC